MKTLTVGEAKDRLGQLIAAANRGESIVLRDGELSVSLEPQRARNADEASPELEAELLKAVGSPVTLYSRAEMHRRFEKIARAKRRA